MQMLDALTRRGYLFQELPPLFWSQPFADCVRDHFKTLPECFTATKAPPTKTDHFSIARPGGLRRRLSLPHPVSFFRLAKQFQENEKQLAIKWKSSPFSRTKPMLSIGSRAIANFSPDRALPRIQVRSGSRYLLKADVAQFYPSIYTHTLPWVLHTKAVAKSQRRDLGLFGNLLDKELQAANEGQTKGIPIGPDTSLGIAELLLAEIDTELAGSCPVKAGIRFIDDIELAFSTRAEAENALWKYESLLQGLELQVNAAKTSIVELPDTFESPFVSTLRGRLPPVQKATRSQWIDYFNVAYELARVQPDAGVLRYALGSIRDAEVAPSCWSIVQPLVWQCVHSDAGCMRFAIEFLWKNLNTKAEPPLDRATAASNLTTLIEAAAAVGHAGEVVWALWAAMLFGVALPDSIAPLVGKFDDSFVAVAARIAQGRKVLSAVDDANWGDWFSDDWLEAGHWLFVYEAHKRGWIPAAVTGSARNPHPVIAFLAGKNVSFVRDDAVESFKPVRRGYIALAGGGYQG